MRPFATGGSLYLPQDDLLKGLGRCLRRQRTLPTRILRSLEWFRLAHYEAEGVPQFSRVVMMATAFEILLDLPRRDKTRCFVQAINDKLQSQQFRSGTRRTRTKKYPGLILPAISAGAFYDLRSHIVHGGWCSGTTTALP